MMRVLRVLTWLGALTLILAACTAAASTVSETAPTATPTPPVMMAGPAGEVELLPTEDPPPGAASQFSTDFSRHIVPYGEIMSGGPPKDGIPAIDDPQFVGIGEADAWLAPQEPVIVVKSGGAVHVYPIQILMWHEIVNDTVGDVPVSVTFCPLCNTAIAFERTLDGQVLDFGTTGRLRFSNLVMYDRQTESWWQQATGQAIAGQFVGRQLTLVPANMVAWGDVKAAYDEARVLSRDTGHNRDYGRNPYVGYDDLDQRPFLYDGPLTPDQLPPMARVLGVSLGGEAVAYPYQVLRELHVVNDSVGGQAILALWTPGVASALDAGSVADGQDVGTITAFSRALDGRVLTFQWDGAQVVDDETGSVWDGMGHAVSGPLAGRQLQPVVGVNYFWFTWAAFRPEGRVYTVSDVSDPADASAGEMESEVPTGEEMANAVDALVSDFEIELYQGQEVLGGSTVRLSQVLAQGKPLVLNLWAGLCPSCRAEMPALQAVSDAYQDQVLVLGVDIGPFVGLGSEQDGRDLLADLDITFPAGSTSEAKIMRDYKVLGTPATYFLKPDGEIIKQWNGILLEDQLRADVEALIEASR